MQIYLIEAKRRNEPKSKAYIVGWRATIDNLVIEKSVTERSVCFDNHSDATMWLTWAMMYLSCNFSYKIVEKDRTETEQSMMRWTQPIWTRCVKGKALVQNLPFYLRKDSEK